MDIAWLDMRICRPTIIKLVNFSAISYVLSEDESLLNSYIGGANEHMLKYIGLVLYN